MAENRKFKFVRGRFVNRVSGEAIPDDEPVMLFRARDNHALRTLSFYLSEILDPHHRQAVRDRIQEFLLWRLQNPERLKEPGITRDIVLNQDQKRPGPLRRFLRWWITAYTTTPLSMGISFLLAQLILGGLLRLVS